MPPPSSAYSILLEAPVTQVVFSSGPCGQDTSCVLGQASADVNSFLVVTTDGRVSVFRVDCPETESTSSGVTVTDNNVTPSYKVTYTKHSHVGRCAPGPQMASATNIVWMGSHLLSSEADMLRLHDAKERLDEVRLEADIYTITRWGYKQL